MAVAGPDWVAQTTFARGLSVSLGDGIHYFQFCPPLSRGTGGCRPRSHSVAQRTGRQIQTERLATISPVVGRISRFGDTRAQGRRRGCW